ncbi:hypothetical protein TNCV_2610111 [Trichonephila clavipes]|nr:hypothetical protein TNCV_2610111 [Trichonephila clavipes]
MLAPLLGLSRPQFEKRCPTFHVSLGLDSCVDIMSDDDTAPGNKRVKYICQLQADRFMYVRYIENVNGVAVVHSCLNIEFAKERKAISVFFSIEGNIATSFGANGRAMQRETSKKCR